MEDAVFLLFCLGMIMEVGVAGVPFIVRIRFV